MTGSTGVPKGVDVKHGAKTNALLSEPGRLGMTVGSKVGQVLSISFAMGKLLYLRWYAGYTDRYCRSMGDVGVLDEWRDVVSTRI